MRYRTWSGGGQKQERYKTLESLEIEPHARDARDARAHSLSRRGIIPLARYRREPAPIPDTRGNDLNIPPPPPSGHHVISGESPGRRDEELDTRGTGTSGERGLYER